MIHNPYNRYFVLPPHAKATDVGSLFLQEGMFAVYDVDDADENGLKAVTNFDGLRKDRKKYEIRVGRNKQVQTRSNSDKAFSTPLFSLNEITELYASKPQIAQATVDEIVIGYNGIDPRTAFDAKKGDIINLHFRFDGRIFGLFNYPGEVFETHEQIRFEKCPGIPNECEECDPCEAVDVLSATIETVDRLKRQPMPGGYTLSDFADISVIHKCDQGAAPAPTTTDMNFYCLEVCDCGDQEALAAIQAQYPKYEVKRVDRKNSTSYYQIMTEDTIPGAYTQRLSSIMKGCEDCPDGYTKIEGGIIYAVTLNDEGVDLSSTVEQLPKAVASTAEKLPGQDGLFGTYTVVTSAKLTAEEIATFGGANKASTVTYVSTTKDMCNNPAINTVAWSACGSCKVATEEYMITLPDDECGNSALEELKKVYPELTITDYGTPGGCQHSFKTTVKTNMVCDECDPIYKDFFRGKAPAPYNGRNWELIKPAQTLGSNCLVGIKIKGKSLQFSPSEPLMDSMVYEEDSVRIAAWGGYPSEQIEGINNYFDPVHVEYLSKWGPRTHVGGDLYGDELQSYVYNTGFQKHQNFAEREFLNEQTRLDFTAQYASFVITIHPTKYSQGFGQEHYDNISFYFYVPYGAHEGVQEFMDKLGAVTGLHPVKI